jgi:L-threonylcarbamoyladenylate synthase
MDQIDLSKAISALKNGEVVVYPTDTLYGLGADIYNKDAVSKVFEIKKRSRNNPLSVAVFDLDELDKIAFVDDRVKQLVNAFLPGKLTLILNKKSSVPNYVTAGLDKIAVRIPDNLITLKLTKDFGPITATSANIHGEETPSIISKINMQFKEKIAVYIDYGKLAGKPSTIVDVTSDEIQIIREGEISKKDILDLIKNG